MANETEMIVVEAKSSSTIAMVPLGIHPYILLSIEESDSDDGCDIFRITVGGGVAANTEAIAAFFDMLAGGLRDGEPTEVGE